MKTIEYHYGIVVARRVISELNKILKDFQKAHSTIRAWSNGREQATDCQDVHTVEQVKLGIWRKKK